MRSQNVGDDAPNLSKKQLLLVLAAVTALGPFAMQLYLPALPQLAQQLSVDQATVQLSVSLYVLAMALAMPFAGPISDQFGRRPVLIASLTVFFGGSLLGLVAWNIESLIIARAIQGAGGAGGLILARAIISDLYDRERMAQLLAQLILVMVIAPTVAPTAGALIVAWAGWRPLFAVLCLFCMGVLFIIRRYLPETLAERRPFSLRRIRTGFSVVLRRPAFVGYTLQSGCSIAFFMAFIATVPYLMVDVLGRPTSEFGFYFLLLAAGYFVGNLAASRLTPVYGGERLMLAGCTLSLIGALLLAGFVAAGRWSPLALFAPMALAVLGSGAANPNSQAAAVKQAPDFAGTASSAASFVQQTMGAVTIQIMGVVGTRSPVPLAWCAVLAASGALVAVVWAVLVERESLEH